MPEKTSPIKILHVITSLEAGGAQAMLYKLLGSMNENEFDQSVVVLMGSGVYGPKLRAKNKHVHTLDMRSGRPSIRSVAALKQIVAKFEPALIQGWMYHANLVAEIARGFAGASASSLWNIRHSINSLSDEKALTRLVIRLGARLSWMPSQIIYNSKVAALQHEDLGYRMHRRVILANGFDTDKFKFSPIERQRIRAELSVADGDFLIGTIARYHPMKDHANLVSSALLLDDKFPNIHFALAGTDTDSLQTGLYTSIEQAGLLSRFHLLGERGDISALMSALDLLVLPSAYGEGFPNVIGEAMACERPCIATEVGDSAIVLGECGEIVPTKNPSALADAIIEVYSASEADRLETGKKARLRIMEHYSLPKIANQYEELYRSVLGFRPSSTVFERTL